jgi:hypothetical protein
MAAPNVPRFDVGHHRVRTGVAGVVEAIGAEQRVHVVRANEGTLHVTRTGLQEQIGVR